ncbi:HAMP domain-containing protein, partial [Salmonella enterica subsp. enterica serovar Virginia]|nr:HAMP domain-containing protein [Salmonella enterica subsp. enterica serovar Virginia]
SITRPLDEAVRFAEAIADGDLTRHITTDYKDETGVLLQALMAGPGAISSTIVWGTRYHSIAHLLGFSVAIALFALCCWGV